MSKRTEKKRCPVMKFYREEWRASRRYHGAAGRWTRIANHNRMVADKLNGGSL